MLEQLSRVPWSTLEHAYGTAEDVPDLLRKLLDTDPTVRSSALGTLYSNVFHQGTRYPATPYVVPFLIELCESSETPAREKLLDFWKSLITGYFSVQQRPLWGNGKDIYWGDQVQKSSDDDPLAQTLHQIYRESLKGHDLLLELLDDAAPAIRAGSAGVLACLFTVGEKSEPALTKRLWREPEGWVRAAIAFALGELGQAEPLRRILADDESSAARCMAACELARINPTNSLLEPLIQFVAKPIEGYAGIPGAGGKSTSDAADAISQLSPEVRGQATSVICERLKRSREFDAMPLVRTLLSTAFIHRETKLTKINDVQRQILTCLVECQLIWTVGELRRAFERYGLSHDREKCAELVGVKCDEDPALSALSRGAILSEIGNQKKARELIESALSRDPLIFDRAPSPEEYWLYCAKAYADTDARRALEAFQRAIAITPAASSLVDPTWKLYELVKDQLSSAHE